MSAAHAATVAAWFLPARNPRVPATPGFQDVGDV